MKKKAGVVCFHFKSHPRTALIVNDENQSRQRAAQIDSNGNWQYYGQ